ncbi:MAG: hypothetical protein VX519_05940 [Myxococcota bacterium]|nr:hypothetical protein [Myxococcota bacterium]
MRTLFGLAQLAALLSLLPACLQVPDRAKDNGEPQDTADGSSDCSANLLYTFPDGTSTTINHCESFSLEASFEFDPDDPPEARTPRITLYATTEEAFECWIRIEEPNACGPGYYQMDGSSGSIVVTTFDCSGIEDAFEGQFVSQSGYVYFEHLNGGEVPGNFSGESLYTTVSGHIDIRTNEGLRLSGDFSVAKDIVAYDAEEQGCSVSDGDEDDDGSVSEDFGGTDCDDTNPLTHVGAAEAESSTDCMTDTDGDGWGSPVPGSDAIVAGTDCRDNDPDTYPGAAYMDSETGCLTDADGDGYGTDNPLTQAEPGTDCDDTDPSTYPGASLQLVTQRWSGPSGADILFLVDQSCSMSDDQALLANGFAEFIGNVEQSTTDWQAMVVNDDSGCSNTGILNASSAGYQEQFAIGVFSGGGSYTESLLHLSANAIEETDPGECNAGFMRPNALLHIVMVSDEPDQSSSPWDSYVDQVVAKKGDESLTRFSAIAGDYPNGCATADPGSGYYEAATNTGGVFLSICATNWTQHMSQLASVGLDQGPSRVLELDYRPYDSSGLVLFLNGTPMPSGWGYNQSDNTIILDTDPSPGDEIIATYTRDVACRAG